MFVKMLTIRFERYS